MRSVTLIILSLVGTAAGAAPSANTSSRNKATPRVALSSSLVIKVADRDTAADALIAATEKLDGYFTTRSDEMVVLKVPVASAKALTAQAEKMGVVIERNFEARDVGALLDEKRTLLKSRQGVFKRYFAVLNSASSNTIVEVEAEMTRLVQEIEVLQGTIRLIEHQLTFAQVIVRFEFHDRRPPVRDGTSSFAWLNTMNLADLIWEFGHEN